MVILLTALGVVGGYGLGQAVDGVRGVLAGGPEGLPADKVAVPEPLDVGGPATTCRAENVELRLSPSTPTVTAGSPMSFMVRVTNVGRVPCLFDGADASRAVTITDESGKERLWSSADCADGTRMLLLGPEDLNARELHWKSERSVAGCEGEQPAVEAGTYQATATLADVPGARSEPVTFTVAEKAKAKSDAKADDAKADDAKADDAKADDAKADDSKAGDAKAGDAKGDDAKSEESKGTADDETTAEQSG